ncbi:4-hydroxy-3-methylbut-2-enyl diphosphate reductase [hydrothermal vent metagenome]|uniref:4-hydroxy-3-methylbut-2-enyl diphosphate reductase n=1 Tax=hydrothermal vent metagenome TaxID=652676 RepID=A0A3B1DJK9_9ZZZZ|nr:4-hydroxy-3-methylbut-2-enyl diphosphate reductase [Candidatus Manganitrophaceae bacterium]
MEVILAEHAGYCFGVKRAVKIADDAAEEKNGSVKTLGPLIHNPQVVNRLAEKGVDRVESLDEVDSGVVIFRSHGVSSPKVMDEALDKGLTVLDATCPFVTNAQRDAKQLVDEGYQVVMVGDRNHPETKSVLGHAGEEILVTESFEEIKAFLNRFTKKRLGIISQTTQTYRKFSEIVVQCLEICEEVKIFNTICYATEDRQTEAKSLAEKVDTMVIVGGKNSANTTHLADICRGYGIPVFHIETEEEIESNWFTDVERVGVTAGASTPDWIINTVIDSLKRM